MCNEIFVLPKFCIIIPKFCGGHSNLERTVSRTRCCLSSSQDGTDGSTEKGDVLRNTEDNLCGKPMELLRTPLPAASNTF